MPSSTYRAATRRQVLTATAATVLGVACQGRPGSAPAGGSSGSAAGTGTVDFWHIWSSGLGAEWLNLALAGLQAKAPRLQVQSQPQDFWTFGQKVTAAAAAGTPPDVTMADSGTSPLRGLTGENRSLDSYISRDGVKLAELVDYQAREVSYAGKTWGLPFRPDTRILFYNKSLLTAAGLDAAKPPTTWDELWTYAERLTKRGGDGKYSQLGFYPGLGNIWFWTMAWTNGAEFVDAKNVPTLNSPASLETLEWYVRWAQKYDHAAVLEWNTSLATSPENDPFYLEKLAMTINTNPYQANIKRVAPNLAWDAALIPSKVRKASWGAGFDLEMPSGGKNPDGAWELIKWLDLDPEMNRQAIQVTSALVAVKAINGRAEFTKEPVWKTIVDSLAITRNRPQVPEVRTWYSTLHTHVLAALEGREGAREALEKAQAEVMGEYETNRQAVADGLSRLQQAR
ncbi:MAG TPA: ABC transporter substrate-binding protein [Chloroflexota bacterium]|nr:ABC transporter substrate-binding protein [Chloroflexota bacterium]